MRLPDKKLGAEINETSTTHSRDTSKRDRGRVSTHSPISQQQFTRRKTYQMSDSATRRPSTACPVVTSMHCTQIAFSSTEIARSVEPLKVLVPRCRCPLIKRCISLANVWLGDTYAETAVRSRACLGLQRGTTPPRRVTANFLSNSSAHPSFSCQVEP